MFSHVTTILELPVSVYQQQTLVRWGPRRQTRSETDRYCWLELELEFYVNLILLTKD